MPSSVRDVVSSGGRPLDGGTQGAMESAFGHNFSRVRVHADAPAARSANEINALAYTVGDHIVFGQGQHRPDAPDGRRLIAHELAHVVQQSHGAAGAASEAHLEADADAAASEAVRGGNARVLGRASERVSRQEATGTPAPAPPAPSPPTRTPTPDEQTAIENARRAAAIRTQVAMFRTSGVVAPGRELRHGVSRSLESQLDSYYMAQKMFEWESPNMGQVADVLRSMVMFLTGGTAVEVAGDNDPQCGNRAAYVRGLRPPIVLCPAFFADTEEEQIRTMIHEAAHLARIGSAALGEGYCVFFTCEFPCAGGFDSADSWAQYVHCVSGQTPDVPPPITPEPGEHRLRPGTFGPGAQDVGEGGRP